MTNRTGRRNANSNSMKYPPGCKEIHVELANDELVRRLKKIQQVYQDLEKTGSEKYRELSLYIGSNVLMDNDSQDVQLLVACCIADVFRIYAPNPPYQDSSNLKKIYALLVNQLKGLKNSTSATFKRYFYLLERLESESIFSTCSELDDSHDIIVSLFETAFKIINEKTDAKVKSMLSNLLIPLLNEPEQISTRVFDVLFTRIIEPQKSNNKEAYNLAVDLIKKANQNFEFFVQNYLNNILLTSRSNLGPNVSTAGTVSFNSSHTSEDDEFQQLSSSSSSNQFISDKLCLIIYELSAVRYALLDLVMPQLEYKIKSSDLKERREYTKLLSKIFSEKGGAGGTLAHQLPQLWEAYLERFADANEDIRKICIQHIGDFLIQHASSIISMSEATTSSNPNQPTLIVEQLMEQIKSRSLDAEEMLRHEVVQEILKAIKQEPTLITAELLNILKDRTLDVKIKVRKLTLQGLAALYKKVHSKTVNSGKTVQLVEWIPSKIMRIYYQDSSEDKLLVERLLNNSIVPYSLDAREKMAQLYYAFTTFDEYSLLSLAEIMKNRVLINQHIKTIIDLIETNKKFVDSTHNSKLERETLQVSCYLLESSKGAEFMKAFVNLLKTNHNLRNYFKNFVNVNCSCSKSMQLIQLMFTNLSELNVSQTALAKRLIERMSSLIVDKECLECLIELIECKIKQRAATKQRQLVSTRRKKSSNRKRQTSSSTQTDSETDNDTEQEQHDEVQNDHISETATDAEEELAAENSSDSETTNRLLVKHIDDDGEKGLKLLNLILAIHSNYPFANLTNYKRVVTFVESCKEHISTASLKLLSFYFHYFSVKDTYPEQDLQAFNNVNSAYLAKLLHFAKHGTPKQAKYAIYFIYNNFERPKNEDILFDLYKDLIAELEAKNGSTYITSLVSLGHICALIPKRVGKEIKEFLSKSVVKDILMQPLNHQLELSTCTKDQSTHVKNNLKLAGKWCENEDELPFNTLVKIQAVKLMTRWCIGLKSECTNIVFTLKILILLIKECSIEMTNTKPEDDKNHLIVSEAEKSRLRSVCGNQLLKLAQEPCFKSLITAEYFHILAKLIIDPVTNVRDILIKKLHKGLKCNRLPINYMSILALVGLDSNRDRKTKVKRLYSSLVKAYRQNETVDKQLQNQKTRILPEMCLSYAVSLIAHNLILESIKDEHKMKQIKECMSMILDPLLESPDEYQIALIKKILNKIKTHDDGLATNMVASRSENTGNHKNALQSLYIYNRSLCLVCEIFLFHMHSKTSTNVAHKETHQFDVKLPAGFYAPRVENVDEQEQNKFYKEVEEHFTQTNRPAQADNDNTLERTDHTLDNLSSLSVDNLTDSKKGAKSSSRRKAKVPNASTPYANQKSKDESDDDDDDDNIPLIDLIKAKKSTEEEDTSKRKNEAESPSSAAKKKKSPEKSVSSSNNLAKLTDNVEHKPTVKGRRQAAAKPEETSKTATEEKENAANLVDEEKEEHTDTVQSSSKRRSSRIKPAEEQTPLTPTVKAKKPKTEPKSASAYSFRQRSSVNGNEKN